MSELTKCNYCTLERLRLKYGSSRIRLRANSDGWIDVLVDGERIGYSFLEVSVDCVC